MIHFKQMISTMMDNFFLLYYMIFPTIEEILAPWIFFFNVYGYILQVVTTPLDYYNQGDPRKERTALLIGSDFYKKYITVEIDRHFSKIWYTYFTTATRELVAESINASYPKSQIWLQH